jgi:hypothetical protein
MLGFACPNCGQPAPISLGSLDGFSCSACGHQGAIPEPVLRSLREAAALLSSLDARHRQLRKSEDISFSQARTVLTTCFLLGVVPWGIFEALATSVAIDRMRIGHGTLVQAIGPLIGFSAPLAMFLVARWVFQRFRSQVETDFAATPPTAEGQQPSCRVCGAELPAPTLARRGVSRCRYCQSDSIVVPSVMQRIAKKQAVVLHEHATAIASYSRSRSNWSGAAAFCLLLLVPFVGWPAHMGWNHHLGPALETLLLHESAPLPHRYVLFKSGAERCIRRIDDRGQVLERASGVWARPRPELLKSTFTAARISEDTLFDRCKGAYGSKLRIYSVADSAENHVVLRSTRGEIARVPLECTCGYGFPGLEVVE